MHNKKIKGRDFQGEGTQGDNTDIEDKINAAMDNIIEEEEPEEEQPVRRKSKSARPGPVI